MLLDNVLKQIEQAFLPDPIECQINGRTFLIERWSDGWMWRNEDGDGQDDFGIAPFASACEAQQSAMDWRKDRDTV